jgi:protein-disulfide isomerase
MVESLLAAREIAPAEVSAQQTVRVQTTGAHALGRPDAPLTIVEYIDLECPFCRTYTTATFPRIKEAWIDTGKLRYISRDLPLDVHPQAMNAARATRCAGDQGRFWEMRSELVRHGRSVSPDDLVTIATALHLDAGSFTECMASDRHDAGIRADMTEARIVGITGTPGFVIGRSSDGNMSGSVILGAAPYSTFDSRLAALLRLGSK